MSDLISGLIVVGITGLVVGLIFILVYINGKKRDEAMQMLASRNGWIYEKIKERLKSGYKLRKHDWTIEAVNESSGNSESSSGSSTVSSITRWFSDVAKLREGIVMIGNRVPDVFMNRLGTAVLLSASGMLNPKEAEMIKDIHPLELGSLELMKRFMIWTNQEEEAKRMVNTDVENCLLNLPKTLQVMIRYSFEGIEVRVQGKRLYQEQDLNALVKLGTALINATA